MAARVLTCHIFPVFCSFTLLKFEWFFCHMTVDKYVRMTLTTAVSGLREISYQIHFPPPPLIKLLTPLAGGFYSR